jgi:hypothetical protein
MAREPKPITESHALAIHCERHGITAYCLICRHLREGDGLAYWAIEPEAEEPAQAWCEACDAVLEQDRGWSDRADDLAEWKLYCAGCYEETLARHILRGWDSGGTPSPG